MQALIDFPEDAQDPGRTSATGRWRARFAAPLAVLVAWEPDAVLGVLQAVQAHALAGRWCVGEVAYEAASGLDAALHTQPPRANWPLVRFAVYADAQAWPDASPEAGGRLDGPAEAGDGPDWQLDTTYPAYANRVAQARQTMADGECYQINLTEALRAPFDGVEPALIRARFDRLRAAQPGGYQAWLDWGDQHVLSLSPELFFDWRPVDGHGLLTCQPMKGTAPRDVDPVRDAQAAELLRGDDKERAENVMIVDLMRNDMGRIAQAGSVQVQQLFGVQALPTVWQMTSTLTARTLPHVGLPEVFAALFPCGSVTGAPKARAMHWIQALESGPRGVYCGAVGVVRPGGAATFNVPIRTITLARMAASSGNVGAQPWDAHCGVGSAITFYANAQAEWNELAAKTRFLERARSGFELLETLRLEQGHYWLLAEHLQRMARSAAYFGFAWSVDAVYARLDALAQQYPQGVYRVRLTQSAAGVLQVQAFALAPTPEPVHFNVSALPVESMGRVHEFMVHKTTRRSHYDARLRPEPGVFDTLLVNERGEITEFTRGNVAVKIDGQWRTPPLHCGLLAGTARADLLARGQVTEAVLLLADLERAEAVAFFNSVRGWLLATVCAH